MARRIEKCAWFECSSCLTKFDPTRNRLPLTGQCNHSICRECLTKTITCTDMKMLGACPTCQLEGAFRQYNISEALIGALKAHLNLEKLEEECRKLKAENEAMLIAEKARFDALKQSHKKQLDEESLRHRRELDEAQKRYEMMNETIKKQFLSDKMNYDGHLNAFEIKVKSLTEDLVKKELELENLRSQLAAQKQDDDSFRKLSTVIKNQQNQLSMKEMELNDITERFEQLRQAHAALKLQLDTLTPSDDSDIEDVDIRRQRLLDEQEFMQRWENLSNEFNEFDLQPEQRADVSLLSSVRLAWSNFPSPLNNLNNKTPQQCVLPTSAETVTNSTTLVSMPRNASVVALFDEPPATPIDIAAESPPVVLQSEEFPPLSQPSLTLKAPFADIVNRQALGIKAAKEPTLELTRKSDSPNSVVDQGISIVNKYEIQSPKVIQKKNEPKPVITVTPKKNDDGWQEVMKPTAKKSSYVVTNNRIKTPAEEEAERTVFIYPLPEKANWAAVKNQYVQYGGIQKIYCPMPEQRSRLVPPIYALVCYLEVQSAKKALAAGRIQTFCKKQVNISQDSPVL